MKQLKNFRTDGSNCWTTLPCTAFSCCLAHYLAHELLLPLSSGASFGNAIPEVKQGPARNIPCSVKNRPQKPRVLAVPLEVSPILGFTQHGTNLTCSQTVYSPIFKVYDSGGVLLAAIPGIEMSANKGHTQL